MKLKSIVLLTVVLTTPAFAGPPDSVKVAACVQKELSQLQFYGGPVDGLIGPGTRQAGDKYIAWMKAGAGGNGWNQPPLTARTAKLWCQKVAEAHKEVYPFYALYLKGGL